MFVGPFHFNLGFPGLCYYWSSACASVGMKLSPVFHSAVYLHILFYIMKNLSLLFYLKNVCCFSSTLTSPLKNLPLLLRQSWLFFSGMVHISITMLHTDLQIVIYIHVCSEAKLSAPCSGTISFHFCIPTTFYYAFHSWHSMKGWLIYFSINPVF